MSLSPKQGSGLEHVTQLVPCSIVFVSCLSSWTRLCIFPIVAPLACSASLTQMGRKPALRDGSPLIACALSRAIPDLQQHEGTVYRSTAHILAVMAHRSYAMGCTRLYTSTESRLLLNSTEYGKEEGRGEDGHENQYACYAMDDKTSNVSLIIRSPYPIPPPAPTYSTTVALLAVSIPPVLQLLPYFPIPGVPGALAENTIHTVTAPSATGPSIAPGASTKINSASSANWSSSANTTVWPPPARRYA